jgi:uncharacterized protein (TIRG00374 family)
VKLVKYLYLVLGVALFAGVLAAFDFGAALDLATKAGWLGVAGLCLTYLVVFLMDCYGWLMTVPSVSGTLTWWWRLSWIRLIGEAFNMVIPAGTFGGEPLKAAMLKSRYGVSYREVTASIVLIRTVWLLAQLVFVLTMAVPILMTDRLADGSKASIVLGALILAAMAAALVLLPRLRLSSRLGRSLGARGWRRKIADSLHHVEDVEGRASGFHRTHPARYWIAFGLSLAKWFLGAGEVWLALWLIGHPVSVVEALMIEAVIQLVRSISFFIPGNLGTQDAAYTLMVAAFTGVPTAGLGAALLRRLREVLFVAAGFLVGARSALPLRKAKEPPGAS